MKIFFRKTFLLSSALIALLLATAAFTGTIQVFYAEIDEWLNPGFYQTQSTGPLMQPTELISLLESKIPNAEVWYLQVPKQPNRSSMLAVSPRPDQATGQYPELENNYYYMDPVNGEIVGARYWGECCFEAKNFMNFTYELHHSLTIPGSYGFQLMGWVACLWVLACITILYRAVVYKKGSSITGFSAPVTAAAAVLILPIAVSSVAMNFSKEIFKPLVSLFSPVQDGIYEAYADREQNDFGDRNLTYQDAFKLAGKLGIERGWTEPVGELFYSHAYNFYGMAFGTRDPAGMGNNWLYLSAEYGSLVGEKVPAGGTAGDLFYFSQLPLHSGRGLGIASKIYIFLMGVIITALSVRIGILSLASTLGRNRSVPES